MNFVLIGGDERAVYLARELKSSENEVGCYAMERAALPDDMKLDRIVPADCYILPVPAEDKKTGLLRASFSDTRCTLSEIAEKTPSGSLYIGGALPPWFKAAASDRKGEVFDLMTRQDFTVGNAAITAEAAVYLLMRELNCGIFGTRVLVTGYGRIGKLLAAKLRLLGAKVTVLSRSAQSRELARAFGMEALSPADTEKLKGFAAAVNTAPAPFPCRLSRLSQDCVLIELASAPGGFGESEAEHLKMRLVLAPGLPAKYAPAAAAGVLKGAVMNIVKEYRSL